MPTKEDWLKDVLDIDIVAWRANPPTLDVDQPDPVQQAAPERKSGTIGNSRSFVERMKTVKLVKGGHGDPIGEANPFGSEGEPGILTKEIGREYDGEHEKAGWRGERWNTDSEEGNIRTARFDEDERERNTVTVNSRGQLVNGDGTVVTSSTLGYVVDPATGKLITFKEGEIRLIRQDPNNPRRQEVQVMEYGLSLDRILELAKQGAFRVELVHHSSPTGGRDVAGAGRIKVDSSGKVRGVDMISGHYKPRIEHLMQVVEHLVKQGAMLDKAIVDSEGMPLSNNAFRFFTMVNSEYEGLKKIRDKIAELKDELEFERGFEDDDDEFDEDRVDSLEKKIDKYKGIVGDLMVGVEMLRTIGAGHRNKIEKKSKVTYYDGKSTTDEMFGGGLDEHKVKVDDFLKSGGGNWNQHRNKKDVVESIKADEKLQKIRQQLDEEAEERNQAFPPTRTVASDQDFVELLARIRKRKNNEDVDDDQPIAWQARNPASNTVKPVIVAPKDNSRDDDDDDDDDDPPSDNKNVPRGYSTWNPPDEYE